VIIEDSKEKLKDAAAPEGRSRSFTLRVILKTVLGALHPFMPFVTEEIWQLLPEHKGASRLLLTEPWPSRVA
jgi:valyl-tRNA synthetase